ncbi:MAG TPA: carboxypeptidase regulatory-like domain-containing protein [Candidatus Baltobacteraceae bacterium]|nr:carboxypeptidase regulatory-like domain-containing protein [Candidatus Baltobacteraceae bacterium]
MKRVALPMCALATALSVTACGMHSNPPAELPQSQPHLMQPMDVLGGPGSRLNVLLGDAPPDIAGKVLQRVDLGLREIDAIQDGQVTVLASYDHPRIVNVLAHQDDSGESVADANVARTAYQQLRLVVDVPSSDVKFEGEHATPLDFLVNVATSSSVGAGATTVTTSDGPTAVDVIVSQPFSIPQDHHQAVRVDFNAFESLAFAATGSALARPSLFVAPIDDMGSIKGHVVSASGSPVANATVVAVASDGSIGNTDWTNDRGRFKIGTLRSGTYTLVIYNSYTTAAGRTVTASGESAGSASAQSITGPTVTVNAANTTSAGSITD